MAFDERKVPVAEGDEVCVSVNAGMLRGVLAKLPGGIHLANRPPNEPQLAFVQVMIMAQLLPDGSMPGVFKLADVPGAKNGSVQ